MNVDERAKNCIVVVPIWKNGSLSMSEIRSLAQLKGVLGGKRDISFMCPAGLDMAYYETIWSSIDVNDSPFPSVERFDDECFCDRSSYSRLMCSGEFYERFRPSYGYMLLYQLDAWVFSDALDEWISAGYDYVGAPWCHNCSMRCTERLMESDFCVGNGGLSLRNIDKACDTLPMNNHRDNDLTFFVDDIYFSRLPGFRRPSCIEASRFSVETNARRLVEEVNGGKLPMGMHNVSSYDPEYCAELVERSFVWKDGLEKMLSAIPKMPERQSTPLSCGGPGLVVSLASYPKRFDYCKRTLDSILHQTIIDAVDRIYINVDDNITADELGMYESLTKYSRKISVRTCPAKWRSANKLLWTYRDHHDDVIVCFDDDKNYPLNSMERLYEEWMRHPECIVAEEVNPYTVNADGVRYIDDVDIKLRQRDFAKYLSNNCLFPPNCFTELLYDYDKFWYVTHGNHDELWFWIVSTLNGVRVIGLDWTYACYVDGIWMDEGDSDLFKINSDNDVKMGYYARMNEMFGEEMKKVMMEKPVQIDFNSDNKVAILNSLGVINDHFRIFPVEFHVDSRLRRSWSWRLQNKLSEYNWYRCTIIR